MEKVKTKLKPPQKEEKQIPFIFHFLLKNTCVISEAKAVKFFFFFFWLYLFFFVIILSDNNSDAGFFVSHTERHCAFVYGCQDVLRAQNLQPIRCMRQRIEKSSLAFD